MDPLLEQPIPYIPVIAGFLVLFVAMHLLRTKLRASYLRREGQIDAKPGRVASIEERVAANRAWASGEIQSSGRKFVFAIWTLAVVWNLTFGVSFFKQLSNPAIKTGGLVVLGLFALVGLPILAFAVRVTMRQLRFGESLCRIHGKAGVVGKGIKGTISTKTEINPQGDYTITLQCIEMYHVGTGKERTSKTEIHWQGTQKVARGATSSRAGIHFSIEIPNYPQETGYQLARGKISWQLSISAPTEGVDYSAVFVVPVFKLQ